MTKICQRVLSGFGMPVEWAVSIVVPIFTRKGDIVICCCYEAMMLLEHEMMVVDKTLE